MAKKKTPPSFEELLDQTEAAVEKLESGELSLEDAMAQYELGVTNLKACAGLIEEAQRKVEQLIATREGELELQELDEDPDA